ncbi:MAG: 4Fe-4S dicluster domain-containing protein [Planctomycetota bacterium]
MLRKTFRWGFRIIFLMAVVWVLVSSGFPDICRKALPTMSPLVALANVTAGRGQGLGLLWYVAPLAILVVAFFRGRFFCRWLCPAGTMLEIAGKIGIRKQIFPFRVSGYILFFILMAALAGAPILTFLDPLSSFTRVTILKDAESSWILWTLGLILPLFFLVSLIQPGIWCYRVCPLGYLLEVIKRRTTPMSLPETNSIRRQILVGLAGIPIAIAAMRYPGKARRKTEDLPILPPGAKNLDHFAALCTRCYSCVSVCPTKGIQVSQRWDAPLAEYFEPVLNPDKGCCEEFCNRCSLVCPSGALSPLSQDEKHLRVIGIARITRDACLSWDDEEYCGVCAEFCPYLAIDLNTSERGVPRPVVNENLCRGCGICQNQCPSVKKGKAIIVHGLQEQIEVMK